jgi:hypothetical protein
MTFSLRQPGKMGDWVKLVTTFRGWPDPTKDNYETLIKTVHPQTPPDTIFGQTESARKLVRQEIWHVIDETSPRSSGGM